MSQMTFSCSGHFMATMGLPCAHMIEHHKGIPLSLDLINSQWRIDRLSFNSKDSSNNDDTDQFYTLLQDLYLKYQVWPIGKKEDVTLMISNLVNQSETFFEPVVKRPKGRPPKAKKKKGITSTTRNPSRFEHVEASLTQSRSRTVIQRNNKVVDPHIHLERFIDLNISPKD
ncbi:hypothetical protein OROHE_022152 [Orobanche hederae]